MNILTKLDITEAIKDMLEDHEGIFLELDKVICPCIHEIEELIWSLEQDMMEEDLINRQNISYNGD